MKILELRKVQVSRLQTKVVILEDRIDQLVLRVKRLEGGLRGVQHYVYERMKVDGVMQPHEVMRLVDQALSSNGQDPVA